METKQLVDNILKVYGLATELEKQEGLAWYSDARKICKRLARKYRVPFKTVCYVMAALSPNNKWHRNILDTDRVLASFVSGELGEKVVAYENGNKDALKNLACTYTSNLIKAWQILYFNDTDFLGNGLKTNNFAQNIYSDKSDAITIDFHAISVAHGYRYTIDTVKNVNFKGKNYEKFVEAYRTAGEKVGLKGYEIQAVVWVAWRNLDKMGGGR